MMILPTLIGWRQMQFFACISAGTTSSLPEFQNSRIRVDIAIEAGSEGEQPGVPPPLQFASFAPLCYAMQCLVLRKIVRSNTPSRKRVLLNRGLIDGSRVLRRLLLHFALVFAPTTFSRMFGSCKFE